MSVNVTGVEQMMVEIRNKVKYASEKQARKGVEDGAEIVYNNMQSGMSYFKKSGGTLEEMKVSNVKTSRGDVKVYIYWEGPKDRYRIIHLNEKGYTRKGVFYPVRGRGAIARSIAKSESPYFEAVIRELRK